MNYIEERLCVITENNKEGRKYYNQWELAKEYMPKILQSISQYFPHYSLHDESHSESILNNIVKILGRDTIDKMSVVDLWLLLTSAYYHDTGMYITAEDKMMILGPDSGFVEYLAKKLKDSSSPMHEYASLFNIKEKKIYYKDNQLTAQNIDALRFLIADYFRKSHAERSAEKIDKAVSLNLPGNPIPQRIIKLLGKICRAHMQTQNEVLTLPKTEWSGCGTESCHPLYIACLLRLGDLLDIDTNRVSEVLLSTLTSIPTDSVNYLGTNRDMTHIHIDQSVIEMTATCKDYHVASLVDKWFEMIKDEVSFQTKNWYLIVPDTSFGALPSTGKMIVDLEGYDNFSLDEKPKFKIDDDRAIEMLQGAGLYKTPSQCIRELLQNAVDATYLRVFKEHPSINSIEEFQERCADDRYNIRVDIKKNKVEDNFVFWQFTLTDQGLGMAKEELKYLSCTGSSRQNEAKQKIIASMPVWMRPSGTFGIGFQSVFLITDIVEMETRRWGREDTLRLTMYNPTGKEKGNILLKTIKNEDHPFGTIINFEIKKEVEQRGYYEKGKECPDIYVDQESLNNETCNDILREIRKFSKHSLINIHLLLENNPVDLNREKEDNTFDFFDEETGLQVKLQENYIDGSRLLFKNQDVNGFRIGLPFLRFQINILSGDARDILTLNRNDVRNEYENKLRNDILISTYKYTTHKFDSFSDEDNYEDGNSTKHLAAAFIEIVKDFVGQNQISNELPLQQYWKEIKLINDDYKKSIKNIGELCEQGNVDHIVIWNRKKDGIKEGIYFYDKQNSIIFNYEKSGVISTFFLNVVYKFFKGIQFNENGILIQKEPTEEYIAENDEARKMWLLKFKFFGYNDDYSKALFSSFYKGIRFFIP